MIFLNNKFYEENEVKISPLTNSFMCGYGVFETLRTYAGKIFCLREHVDRLFISARLIGIKPKWSKKEILACTEAAFRQSKLPDARIKIVLTEEDLLIWPQKLILRPAVWYQTGIRIVTYRIERVLPEAKSLNCLPFILAHKYAEKKGVYESLFIDEEGYAREGSWSNLFWIKNNALYTTNNKILAGITREMVLKLGRKIMRVKEQDEQLKKILRADEVFITNTTSEILPIMKIDQTKIGNGKVGKWTRKLMWEFKKHVKIITH